MWNVVVIIVMTALTGFYILPIERTGMALQDVQASKIVESMAVYRQAVKNYFSANNVTGVSVGIDALKNAGAIPAWAAFGANSTAPAWANYRDSTGTIYIYPATLPSSNIVSAMLQQSRNSMNVGIYRASDHSLYSPVDGTRVTLASLAGVPIPDKAPVWMAAPD